MRLIPILCLLLAFVPVIEVKAGDKPSCKIYDVDKESQGGLAVLDFFIKAKDSDGIKYLEYRAAVDGKQSKWKRYPYYDGITNHLFFRVDCNIFILEVRSVDGDGKESKVVRKRFSGL